MTELERYTPRSAEVDSWTEVLVPVADLANKIGATAFVPDSLRGNTAGVAAAILTGREMGVGPMVSLRHIHLIKGKPGQSAELMRALILAQGHKIRYVETTDTRCVVDGRRADEQDWTRVMFTADQARRAKIDLGGYPEDKLVARATARLCRRIFADVIAGMPYTTDELEDLDVGEEALAPAAEEKPKRRTAQRAKTKQADPPAPPPLPGEEVPPPAEETHPEPPADQPEPITKPQLTKLHTVFSAIGWDDRDDRLRAASTIVGRLIGTSTELTKAEAHTLIDTLEMVASQPDPSDRLGELLAEVRRSEQGDDSEPVDAEIVGES